MPERRKLGANRQWLDRRSAHGRRGRRSSKTFSLRATSISSGGRRGRQRSESTIHNQEACSDIILVSMYSDVCIKSPRWRPGCGPPPPELLVHPTGPKGKKADQAV